MQIVSNVSLDVDLFEHPIHNLILSRKSLLGRRVHMGRYDTAQICLKGYVINPSSNRLSKHNKKFCDKCGFPTITNCQNCGCDIQGRYHDEASIRVRPYIPPAFCYNCGAPFPWTEAKLKAFREYTELLEIPKKDKEALEKNVHDIVISTETTPVSATRFKQTLSKAGKGALEGAKEIVIDIISETAKKIIWP